MCKATHLIRERDASSPVSKLRKSSALTRSTNSGVVKNVTNVGPVFTTRAQSVINGRAWPVQDRRSDHSA